MFFVVYDFNFLVTGFAVGRLELVELGAALAGESALGRLAVKIGSGAVVERSVQIDPDLGVGIAVVLGCGRSLRRFGSLWISDQCSVG